VNPLGLLLLLGLVVLVMRRRQNVEPLAVGAGGARPVGPSGPSTGEAIGGVVGGVGGVAAGSLICGPACGAAGGVVGSFVGSKAVPWAGTAAEDIGHWFGGLF
jgi:hypothetical protein